jgi:copper resistance protein B
MTRPTLSLLVLVAVAAFGSRASAQHPGHEQPSAPPQRPQSQSEPATSPAPAKDHSTHQPKNQPGGQQTPKEPIPPITDADRAAAFPQGMKGHAVHDQEIHYMVLFDQLEWEGDGKGGPGWDSSTWIGGDINRVWLRSEGESHGGRVESAFLDVLWGRSVSRWWDVVAGVRQDFRPGPAQTWVGGGVQGLAPYFFELEATGYVGANGRTLVRLEADYDLLITNRLILQPTLEAELHGKSDIERGVGRGLSTLEGGLRLRYELKREFAPFIGVAWTRSFFGTADLARAEGEDVSSARLVVGLRTWF